MSRKTPSIIKMVDFGKEYTAIKRKILPVIESTLKSGWYILGEEVRKFEKEFAKYVGTKYAIGVNSGTDALLLALKALGIGRGDEVITVSHTFVTTVEVIIRLGARPVLVDINPDTYTMDVSLIEKKISRKTKAIIPVHLYGNPVDMKPLMKITRKHGIHIVEDACQAHGAEYKGRKVGTFGILSAFSFYPTKNLGGYGDGGMILTNNAGLHKKAVMLRRYGWKDRYESEIMGINSRLDEIQAAILRVKLKYLDKWNKERIRAAQLYRKLLKDTNIILPKEQDHSRHVYHQFVIRCNDRDKLQKRLSGSGIQTQIHYPIPIHMQKAFKYLGRNVKLPVTEKICKQILSLPIHPGIRDEEIVRISKVIKKWL